jgi:hypothetical protein
MAELVTVRSNIFYTKNKEGQFVRANELIFLTDEAEYRKNSEGEIVRERKIVQHRMMVRQDALLMLAKALTEFHDSSEEFETTNQ